MIDIVDPSAGVQDLLPSHGQLISNAVRETRRLGQTENKERFNNKKFKNIIAIDLSISVTGVSSRILTFVQRLPKQTNSICESQRGTFQVLMMLHGMSEQNILQVGPQSCMPFV